MVFSADSSLYDKQRQPAPIQKLPHAPRVPLLAYYDDGDEHYSKRSDISLRNWLYSASLLLLCCPLVPFAGAAAAAGAAEEEDGPAPPLPAALPRAGFFAGWDEPRSPAALRRRTAVGTNRRSSFFLSRTCGAA